VSTTVTSSRLPAPFTGWSAQIEVNLTVNPVDDRLQLTIHHPRRRGRPVTPPDRYGVYRNGPGWWPIETAAISRRVEHMQALVQWWSQFADHPDIWRYRVLDAVAALPNRARADLIQACAADAQRPALAQVTRAVDSLLKDRVLVSVRGRHQLADAGITLLAPAQPCPLGVDRFALWASHGAAAAYLPIESGACVSSQASGPSSDPPIGFAAVARPVARR
jgi:hypothetical protein